MRAVTPRAANEPASLDIAVVGVSEGPIDGVRDYAAVLSESLDAAASIVGAATSSLVPSNSPATTCANGPSFPMNKNFSDSESIMQLGLASRRKPNHPAAFRGEYNFAARPQASCLGCSVVARASRNAGLIRQSPSAGKRPVVGLNMIQLFNRAPRAYPAS